MQKWLLAAAMVLPAHLALAQQQMPCAPVDAVLGTLEKNAGELPASIGRDERGFVAMLTLSPDGSYSILGLGPDGIACVLSTGSGWKPITSKPSDKGA